MAEKIEGFYLDGTEYKFEGGGTSSEQNLFIITEDIVTVSTSEDTGVAPYNTSYKYTNFDIDANAGIEWKEGAIYTFVVDTEMVVASAYRNVRVRIGSGTYIPVMGTTAAAAGSSYFVKTAIRQFQYTTKYESGGALHVFTDSNTTYKAMTAAQATAGTATTALTISPSILKGAIEEHAPVQSVNGSTGAVTVQPTLVSGTNIKTINNESLLGSGNITISSPDMSNYLAKDNTTAFTPTGDYQPATKKYVDDTASSAASGKVSDTAYASSWNGVTNIAPSKNAVYDKLNAMNTTISGKQAALNSDQLAAVNSGITATKVGTYDGYATSKQDKLTTQTAYSQKGSATKVPQITTNTLGQVTGITEVDIGAGGMYSAGNGISIGDVLISSRQGPCQDGFHIPSMSELSNISNAMRSQWSLASDKWVSYFKMPNIPTYEKDGTQNHSACSGANGIYWTSTSDTDSKAYVVDFNCLDVAVINSYEKARAFGIRPFKNSYVEPDSTWTVYYGSLGGDGIFYNESKGLISFCNGQNKYTLSDKNVGAVNVGDRGYVFQWGNDHGFTIGETLNTSPTQVNASTYGPNNHFISSTFIVGNDNWDSSNNNDLRGDITNTLVTKSGVITNTGVVSVNGQTGDVTITSTEYNAGQGILIGDVTINGRQGPSPDGFHVPSSTEREGVKTIMSGLSLTTGNSRRINLHIPFAGYRSYSNSSVGSQNVQATCWSSSSTSANSTSSRFLSMYSGSAPSIGNQRRAFGYSVRAFKDTYVTPDSSWTVVQGTLGSAGIFWNQSEGLISITDGTTGYTIMDKNLGATTVYNDGDTLTQSNIGNYYQWGNNYGFPSTGSVTTSSAQVDASGYGPNTANGYYESSTFITGSDDWSSIKNGDLWGDTTGTITQENVISNTGVLSVNGQIGNVIVQSGSEASGVTTTQPSNPVAGSTYYDTTSSAVKVYDGAQWNELGSGGGGGGLGLEYMSKVTLNGSGDGDHWLNTGVGSLAYDAYVVCLTNSTCRFILGVELGDYNYPRAANNDIKNGIMQVSGDSKWLRAGEKLFIYDYYGSGAVYNFYIYKFTRPS